MKRSECISLRINDFLLAGTLKEEMNSLTSLVETVEDAKRVVEVLEKKGTEYTALFIDAYISAVIPNGYPSYKQCNLASKTEPAECTCSFQYQRTEKAMENLIAILQVLRKTSSNATDRAAAALADAAISTFSTDAVLEVLDRISVSESMGVSVIYKLAEIVHMLHAKGLYYEAFRAIEVLSKLQKVPSSVDRFTVMVMCKYFLFGNNYRAYACGIERLQQMGVCISPIPVCLKYAAYQKIITDCDSFIRHRPLTTRKELNPEYTTVFSVEIDEYHWEWYLKQLQEHEAKITEKSENPEGHNSGISNNIPSKGILSNTPHVGIPISTLTEDQLLQMISFLRTNRLRFSLDADMLSVMPGNTSYTYTDYVLGRTEQDLAQLRVKHLDRQIQQARKPIAQTEADAVSSIAPKKQKRNPMRGIFEEREFAYRLCIKALRNDLCLEKEEETKQELQLVNERFRISKQREASLLKQIADSYSYVISLAENLGEKHKEEKEKLEKERLEKEKEKTVEQTSPEEKEVPEEPKKGLRWEGSSAPPPEPKPENKWKSSDTQKPVQTKWKKEPMEPKKEIKKLQWRTESESLGNKKGEETPTQPSPNIYRPKEPSQETKARFEQTPEYTATKQPLTPNKLSWNKRKRETEEVNNN